MYRLYDADGNLLYIGSAYDPEERCRAHYGKPWWQAVARLAEEWHPNRSCAYLAETKAIKAEMPKHNRMGTPEYGREISRRQLVTADERRVKCTVAAEGLKIRKRVARELQAEGCPESLAVARGMLAERAYKEASGAFPNGVEYPPLEWIEERLAG